MGVNGFKIGSGECNNLPLIDFISKYKKPIILSTGMNDISKIKKSVEIIKKNKCQFAILHCVSLYPTPYEKLNLNRMKKLKKIYPNNPVGLSDHTLGIHASLAAVSLGANIIEKHFTSSKKWPGPDIPISIDKNDLRSLKKFSEDIFSSLNNNPTEKKMRYFEKKTINFAYSSVVSVKNISKGEKLNIKNIWVKRPGQGDYLAKDFKKLLGKKTTRFVPANKFIKKRTYSETMKIAFTASRADYGKIKPLILQAKKKRIKFSIFATGTHLLKEYGGTLNHLKKILAKKI